MKRICVLVLVLCLLLCGCGATRSQETNAANPTAESTAEPTTEPTEPPVLYRHPLTGALLEEPFDGRITAVVINNLKYALPQFGISKADMIYELITEGDITRILALYSSFDGVGSIGPIRSARTYFNSIAVSYDAPIVHCGGSHAALRGQYDDSGDRIDNWEHINEAYNGDYFFRDRERYKNGYAWEHTLFTNGDLISSVLEKKGYGKTETSKTEFGLNFADDVYLDGAPAEKVTVKFRGGKTTTMTYDAVSGLYRCAEYGSDHIDAGNGEVMKYRNVLALYTKQWGIYDGVYTRSYYKLVGSGDGIFACGGKYFPITWSRKSLREPFTYTLKDGTPITLGVGKTYVGISATGCEAVCE